MNNLIVCPTDQAILGALNTDGNLVIRRWMKNKANHEVTVISSSLTLVCQCGFGTTITATHIAHLNQTH